MQIEAIKDIKFINLGNSIKNFGIYINNELNKICKSFDVDIELKLYPILILLQQEQSFSIQELAGYLNVTHPAVVQMINTLKLKELITTQKGTNDKRQNYATLTKQGDNLLEKWNHFFNNIKRINKELLEESGVDLLNNIETIKYSLEKKSYAKRMNDIKKESLLKEIEIISYNKKYAEDFKILNHEWLKKYFTVEPEDEKLLNNPDKYIIKKGGEIFFARLNNEIIGTCAVIKIDKNIYELSKMAVTQKAQGKQVGKKLALSVIGFAFSKNAKYITLLTNKKLFAAINLYKQLGFEIETEEVKSNYEREIFRMTLLLR